MKKALAMISFGTSNKEAEQAIVCIEQALEKEFPDYHCFRAFTSKIIIQKIEQEQKRKILTPKQLLSKLAEQGYTEVICQPTHMLHGMEYDALQKQIESFKNQFTSLKIGMPMLHDLEDYRHCATIYQKEMEELKECEAVVLMGHGTKHFVNSAYCQMEKVLKLFVNPHYYMATVEGFPTIEDVIIQLKQDDICKVRLVPFMIVSGEHAHQDMAGEAEDSWKNQLERAGYETEVCFTGLGEYEQTAQLFISHVRKAKEI